MGCSVERLLQLSLTLASSCAAQAGLTVTQLVLLNPQLVNNPSKTCKVAIGQSLCKGQLHMT
jgi:hypothetical protein